jgi:hypothetical protein
MCAGNWPLEMEYVSGRIPPDVLIVVLGYGTPTVAVAGIEVVVIIGAPGEEGPLPTQFDSTTSEMQSAMMATARNRSMTPPEYSATERYRMWF